MSSKRFMKYFDEFFIKFPVIVEFDHIIQMNLLISKNISEI